jgi:hypothetical protein
VVAVKVTMTKKEIVGRWSCPSRMQAGLKVSVKLLESFGGQLQGSVLGGR